jgi:hypothetical protein
MRLARTVALKTQVCGLEALRVLYNTELFLRHSTSPITA